MSHHVLTYPCYSLVRRQLRLLLLEGDEACAAKVGAWYMQSQWRNRSSSFLSAPKTRLSTHILRTS